MSIPHAADPFCSLSPAGAERRRQSGFTVMELVATVVIATVVLGGALVLVGASTNTMRDSQESLGTLRSAVDALVQVRRDLNRAKMVKIADDGTSIQYSLPVSAGESGAFLDGEGNLIWGVEDIDGVTLGGTVKLAFVQDRTLSEADASQGDLNGDGDRADTFVLGHLTRTSSNGHRLAMPRVDVLLPSANKGGDVDGNGTNDPLFSVHPTRNEITVRLARFNDRGHLRAMETHCGVVACDEGLRGAP
jgi:type II secretory pathway pseudopilin PulG